MNNSDLFSGQYFSYQWERIKETEESNITGHNGQMRHVVHFHAVSHVSDTCSFVLEAIGQKSNIVTSLHQALTKLVAMSLYSTKFRECKISADQYVVLLT